MTNKEFITKMVNAGYITKTELAVKNNLEYDKLIGVIHGRKKDEAVSKVLESIGVSDDDLPLEN